MCIMIAKEVCPTAGLWDHTEQKTKTINAGQHMNSREA